ncbi:uncharacterized protein LOC111779299 [Cucurbita pepo subsp. pepo]|uniref:uncharacterized protein LOC111779299 n=1 Tax=Cucurbita pepo subsp. pepo TaxID=3664 RepID=UPI000C9D73AC|nr:uncharacterized protein LOC111779299 [Cucurbita pepo subsp. pepo]
MIVGTRVFGSHLMVGSMEPMMMMKDSIGMEDGEASCYYKESGRDVDPDITLSYIDEKIERFLGHFQKDFERGVSAENLGSKFGGYGSFLPTYEHRPSILPHQSNQQRECKAAPSPDNVLLKGSSQNPKVPPPGRPEAVVCNTIPPRNARETSGSISGRVDSCLPATKVTNSCPSKDEASISLGCSMDKRSLKLRIKVGSNSTGLKNAAIYSGLGLDDSPPSSEKTSDVNEGMLPISQCPPDESLTKIIEEMTAFPVPDGALISPLHESLLGLSRKEKPLQETKSVLFPKDKKDGLAKLADETNSTLVENKKKEVRHIERHVSYKNEVCASLGKETTTLVNGKLENEAFESKNFVSNKLPFELVSEGMMPSAYLDPQKKKLSCKTTLHKAETDTDKGSIKKEKSEIVGKKKLEVPQTASRKTAGSVEKGFEFRSKASKIRKDTDADTPESENRRHSNQKAGAINRGSFNSSGLDGNRKSKGVIDRASGDLRKVKRSDDSENKTSKSSMVVEPAVVAPVDEWVCCDSCQKWRLLPFGKKPKLPEKWLCSMLNWLPGMNRCDISEEETTEKLYALYQLPLPGSGDVSQKHANGLTSGDTSKQGKRKDTSKEIQNPVSRNDASHVKSSLKNQQLELRKNKSLNGYSNHPDQLRNSRDQSSSDLHNLVEGKNRGQLKEKSIDRGGEVMLKHSNVGLKMHNKLNVDNEMKISSKKWGETAGISSVDQVNDKSACTNKRKLKDCQDVQKSHNSSLHEPVLSKEETCERLNKKKKSNVSNGFAGGTEEISKDKEPKMPNNKITHRQTSVGTELPKRNLGVRQVSVAANSTSSNVSQPHLTKAKFSVKVSPVVSVSSSPIKTSSLDRPRFCNNHIGDSVEPSHKKRKNVFPDKEFCTENKVLRPASNEKDKSISSDVELDKLKASDGMSKRSKKSTTYVPEVDSYHDAACPNGTGEIEGTIPQKHGIKLTKKETIHVGAEGLKSPRNLKGYEDQRSNRGVGLQMKRSRDSEAGIKGVLRTVERGECKEEPSCLGGDSLRVSSRAGNSHQLSADAPKSDDAVESKALKERTKSSDQTASNTLKEAKKLKDKADNLKGAGFVFESNELYFQSALKYLHGAFLLETPNNATDKHGDMTHMQFYGIAAELCEICALEFQGRREMVAAALAFKCIEVAYLRIVYHKHSSVNGDRLEMQSLFRTIVQGESPSSSASDVDNFSNQGVIDKITSDRVGGSHIWNFGNCTSFARVLDFARNMNSAMEASAKSQSAFVAAASSCATERKHVDYVASVKKVIDFSFQDVGELVELVRVAMQAVTQPSFCSGRD